MPQASAAGPHGSLEDTRDGFFYTDKRRLLGDWVEGWGCGRGHDWQTGWQGTALARTGREPEKVDIKIQAPTEIFCIPRVMQCDPNCTFYTWHYTLSPSSLITELIAGVGVSGLQGVHRRRRNSDVYRKSWP